jgi:Na+/melibiose symporter-like transporter
MTLPFSMLADTVDYGEWKTGVRAAGLLTAVGGAFCFKVGAGLGGAVPMGLLHAGGYIEGKEQVATAIAALDGGIIGVPVVCFVLALLPVLCYGRFERLEPQIQAALAQRRVEQASGNCGCLGGSSKM